MFFLFPIYLSGYSQKLFITNTKIKVNSKQTLDSDKIKWRNDWGQLRISKLSTKL